MIQRDGAAGENESPDSHPDHSGQENARFSGLNIVPRAQVQVVEDTGGHLGPILAPRDICLLSFHPSSEARRLLAESGEQKETEDVGSSLLAL